MNGTVKSVNERTGDYGKFTVIEVDGHEITAFNAFHETARTLSPGDPIEFSFELKGKYKRFTSLRRGTASVTAAGVSGSPSPVREPIKAEFLTREESILASYAKDLLGAGIASTPEGAVATVWEIAAEVKKKLKENPQT